MRYLKDIPAISNLNDFHSRWNEYYRYLSDISQRLPEGARYFANADWHWDFADHRCPHDAWLKKIEINENRMLDVPQSATVNINIALLGAYHDGYILLHYFGVRSYKFDTSRSNILNIDLGVANGHGDWYMDEISLSDDGFPVHEIQFTSSETCWSIEAEDIVYEWLPVQGNYCNIENMLSR